MRTSCFFCNNPAAPEISTLPLRDALPICLVARGVEVSEVFHAADGGLIGGFYADPAERAPGRDPEGRSYASYADRKSTRLNSSHANISYAVFCLKKKNKYEVHRCRQLSCL